MFPGKYHQNGGFSMTMLVYRNASELCNQRYVIHVCDLHFWQGVEPEAMAVDQFGEPIKGLSDMWSAGVVWSLSLDGGFAVPTFGQQRVKTPEIHGGTGRLLTVVSYLGRTVTFQGRTVKLREGSLFQQRKELGNYDISMFLASSPRLL